MAEKAFKQILDVGRLPKRLNIFSLALLIVCLFFSLIAYQSLTDLNRAAEGRYQSYLLTEELRLSSDQLTLMARAYTVTGEQKYLDFFNQILAIRNGTAPRPENYQWVYWDMLMPSNGEAPFQLGKAQSLESKMHELGFTEQEFEQLNKAKAESDALTKIEYTAFQNVELAFTQPTTDFNQQHNNIITSLYQDDYLQAKAKIMSHINVFYQLQAQRTATKVAQLSKEYQRRVTFALISAIALILSLFAAFYVRAQAGQKIILLLKAEVGKQTSELADKNIELERVINNMNAAQKKLIESEKMASLGGLVSGIAHEVNTPLGISATLASHLKEESDDLIEQIENGTLKRSTLEEYTKDTQENCRIMLKNIERAAALIRSFKKIAVDQSAEELRSINMSEYVLEVLASLKPKFKHSAVNFVTDFTHTDKQINSDPGAIAQVLTNLIFNAFIHAYDDGKNEGDIHLSLIQDDAQLQLSIKDKGKGMSEEVAAHIFEPFYTTNRNNGGSGLGMSIVYNLVTHRLNGHIQCYSVLNEGTEFVVTVPVQGEA